MHNLTIKRSMWGIQLMIYICKNGILDEQKCCHYHITKIRLHKNLLYANKWLKFSNLRI